MFRHFSYEFGYEFRYCKSGGGSGGGGGSGQVDYPDYMKTVHNDWLDNTGTDNIESSVTDIMNAALGSSPFTGAAAYDPTTPLSDAWDAVCAFNAVVDALDNESDWQSAIVNIASVIDDNIITDTYVNNDVIEYSNLLDDELDAMIAKFEAGMRDINAVSSSAFVIGRALIEGMKDRDVAKYLSELRMKLNFHRNEMIIKSTDRVLTDLMSRVEFEKAVASISVEAKRIHIVAKKEQGDQDLKIDEMDAKWDLEVFAYGGNLLASIGGGVAQTDQKQLSPVQSAIGGALAGAAAGTAISPGWGTAIGAAVGLGASLLS